MNLQLKNISKIYPRKTVLDDVSVTFEEGRINVLAGENGAGKTTLVNIICGSILPDKGQIFCNNRQVNFKSEKDALNNGIAIVRQRPLVAGSITVKENILLGVKITKEVKNTFENLLNTWTDGLKPDKLTCDTNASEHLYTALLNALIRKPSVLILDEPGAMLDIEQRKSLFKNLTALKASGTNIILITHNSFEIQNYADTVTYLDDGKVIPVNKKFLSQAEFNNEKQNSKSAQMTLPDKEINFKRTRFRILDFNICYKNLYAHPLSRPAVFDAGFEFSSGRITLIQGSREAGLETLENIMYMMEPSKFTGTLCITTSQKKGEHDISKFNTSCFYRILNSYALRTGIVPSDKTFRGSNPDISVLEMLSVHLKTSSGKKRLAFSNYLIKKACINITPFEKVSNLSGGMLQKLLLERELFGKPDILFVCSGFQGLDIQNTQKLKNRLSEYSQQGKSVVLLSPDDVLKENAFYYYKLEGGRLCRIF